MPDKTINMDKDLHNIEDLFKSALEDNEEMPSAKLWDAVDIQFINAKANQ